MLSPEWSPNDSKPPTDEDRLELFSDLAHQYDVATRSLREADHDASRHSEDLTHGRFVRAALLRKFFIDSDSHVHLDKVVESIEAVARAAGTFDDALQAECDTIRASFLNLPTTGQHITNTGGPTQGTYTPGDVFKLVAYGNVLHADYGKWRQTRTHASRMYMASLAGTVHNMEHVLLSLIDPVDQLLGDHRGRARSGTWAPVAGLGEG